jgi:four helix bundle protein
MHGVWGHGARGREEKMAKFRFQDLEIWKEAIEIGDALFGIADELEEKKLFRFAEQLRGAGMSMSNNIAEGSGSNSKAEFRNFLNMAKRSAFENANILILLNKRGLINRSTMEFMLERLEILCRKIINFQRSLNSVKSHAPRPMPHALITNEKGAILITMLLLMVIVTLLGVIAINTSTIDIQITGHSKREALALQGAEAGIDLSIPIIESTLAMGQLSTSTTTVSTAFIFSSGSGSGYGTAGATLDTVSLSTEITGGSDYNTDTAAASPDIAITDLKGVDVNVDIDRLYSYALAGGSLEFASGYEGAGAGAGGGGVGILYGIDSQGAL